MYHCIHEFRRKKVFAVVEITLICVTLLGCGTGDTTTGGTTTGGTTTGGTTTGGTTTGGTDLPNSKIADQNTSIGVDTAVSFTLTQTTHNEYRYTPRNAADCAVITADQVAAFRAGQAYTGYFANAQHGGGCGYANLPAGTYYLAMRDATGNANSNNSSHFEIDDATGLSSADGMHYLGELVNPTVLNLAVNQRSTNEFTIQANTRNFLFGCNTGQMNSYIIPKSQEAAFRAGQQFTSYKDYDNPNENDEPYYDLSKLPPGTYALAVSNTTSLPGSYAYEGPVWAFNSKSAARLAKYDLTRDNRVMAKPEHVPALSDAAIANLSRAK
jgi:hypothetical protein